MDHLFFSWLATQSYSVEVAIGTIFAVVIAPAVLVGMASCSLPDQSYGTFPKRRSTKR